MAETVSAAPMKTSAAPCCHRPDLFLCPCVTVLAPPGWARQYVERVAAPRVRALILLSLSSGLLVTDLLS
jgi:hypothetical protein